MPGSGACGERWRSPKPPMMQRGADADWRSQGGTMISRRPMMATMLSPVTPGPSASRKSRLPPLPGRSRRGARHHPVAGAPGIPPVTIQIRDDFARFDRRGRPAAWLVVGAGVLDDGGQVKASTASSSTIDTARWARVDSDGRTTRRRRSLARYASGFTEGGAITRLAARSRTATRPIVVILRLRPWTWRLAPPAGAAERPGGRRVRSRICYAVGRCASTSTATRPAPTAPTAWRSGALAWDRAVELLAADRPRHLRCSARGAPRPAARSGKLRGVEIQCRRR